jgi:DNA-binding response OmpR family regulator
MKILLIEDDKDISELYQGIFKDNSFEIDIAFDGEVGMEKISKGDFDVVIVDIMLPSKDGLDILQESKKKGLLKNKKVLVLSSIDRNDVLEATENFGAQRYIVKSSVNPQELIDIINNL